MKRITILIMLFLLIAGCSEQQTYETSKITVTEQEVRNAITELISGLNSGNIEVVGKYVDTAGPVAEQLVEKFKNNIKLYDVRDISIQGNTAQATVTLEVVPLKVKKDITLNFDAADVLLLNNPLGLLSIFL